MGDPGLGTVNEVSAVGRGGFALQRGSIGAGLRLGQAVRADLLAGQHARQPPRALLIGAEHQQRVARQAVHADGHRDRCPARGDLLQDLEIDLERLAAATPFLRLRQAQQSGRAELGEDALGIGLVALMLVDDRAEHLVADVPGQRDEVGGVLVGGEGGRRAWVRPLDRY